ncbi:helix-turn-helix domain-containing protein [Lactiplantibacillus plantarum]|uniref:helix-turn-helix domain-containing protein n=1 Tax=Lactiplantibacillus plantarum TaxID=1590 RepID=UPI0018AD5AF0|nr:helix-turn-helix transcriptional regulator [Lactiplantibacillus plantarum]UWF30049.1 helix-turn-helix domain-containing protein [Lactiplantibacillus plantarum]UWF40513.1 helix-turn-helix domain-containing protein [Lactiplantibacillus plantarum]UWF43512.1 helix-turn-helix domain-containing protein [Lactiplantibacillus plantarum]WGF85987.1 helix-turn-helix transcriptional regulator [Lactiplantibacillus plantarum]WGG43312.1 helix-turn-helix transcriptional regulator [Lactiplantibacillus planta
MILGFHIRELRKSKNLNQEQLGKILNVSKASISGYENETREPDKESLIKLAKYFNVTLDYLLGTNQTPKWSNKPDTIDLKDFLEANECSITYGGGNLTEEEKQQVRVAMATIFWKRHAHD